MMTENETITYRVQRAYQAAYAEPWTITAGTRLTVHERDSEWPGWVWCTADEGEGRWVPEPYLKREGSTAIAREEYDATELSVQVGDRVTATRMVNDWAWCCAEDGQEGWVPLAHLSRMSNPTPSA